MTMKTKPKHSTTPSCSVCGQYQLPVMACDSGFVCEACSEKARTGRDGTTRAVKTMQRSLRSKADKARAIAAGGDPTDQQEYDIASSELLVAEAFLPQTGVALLAGGEVIPQHSQELVDTLAAPNVVALDASAHRLDLVTRLGTDVAAMALDAADTMLANNSLEKMLAHQMAVLHSSAMTYAGQAALAQDQGRAVSMMNLALRSMETFQKGLVTIKRLRGTGEQRITIQHVNVGEGGRAVIGQVNPAAVKEKYD
jgi:hypothetical protein